MTILSAAQVAGLVKNAGFPSDVQAIMVAICKAESGYNVGAKNPSSSALGLFQILYSAHKSYDYNKLLTDGQYNTNAAHDIYQGQGLRAWVVYTNNTYTKYLNEARSAVAHAASVTGSAVTSLDGRSSSGSGQPAVTYGPPGPQYVTAGVGTPIAADSETNSPLKSLRVLGTELGGDFSSVVIGEPSYSSGMETAPNLTFAISDPGGNLLFREANIWVRGSHVSYQDLNMRIDTVKFTPGDATGQIEITCVHDVVYRLMELQGPRTASGISASQWLADELRTVGLNPAEILLAEAVPSQSQISRDVPDQTGTTSSEGDQPSAWTTIVRLARELGKRVFISGKRLVFGSSAFAMRWCAPGSVRISWDDLDWSERFITLPEVTHESISSRSNVVQCKGKIPLARAQFFRPGCSVIARSVPALAGASWRTLVVFDCAHDLGTDVDGADVTLIAPVDPPAQPPTGGTSAGINAGSTSNGASVSGGGADGQVARFVALALQQAGKRYVYGAYASPSNPNPTAFDCSELVQWCCERTGISGCPRTSAAQRQWCSAHGTLISVSTAINTKGALLFANGHVAISLGNGKTIEAMDAKDGVRQGNATGNRGWIAGGKIPGAQGYR